MKLLTTIFCLFFLSAGINAQEDTMEIFIQKNRYAFQDRQPKVFKNYIFFGNYYIDRKKENIINLEQLKEGLDREIPNKNASVLISLDIENQVYHDLKSFSSRTRRKAADEFIKMVRFVKKQRPNAKVGIYGIPFSFNYDIHKYNNHYRQLKPLLKEVDYLSPSLYFHFSEEEQSDEELYSYIRKNLELFLEYSHKLDKPVYLYTWYLVHPYNKNYGMKIVSKKRMNTYFNFIKNIDYKGTKVKGIIWWQPSTTDYKLGDEPKKSITEILLEYTNTVK